VGGFGNHEVANHLILAKPIISGKARCLYCSCGSCKPPMGVGNFHCQPLGGLQALHYGLTTW
jgi:hypothetical protein